MHLEILKIDDWGRHVGPATEIRFTHSNGEIIFEGFFTDVSPDQLRIGNQIEPSAISELCAFVHAIARIRGIDEPIN